MNNPSIIDSMVDSMLSIERKDMLIDTCRKLFIEKDFSCMQTSVQKELKAIFDEDNIPVSESPRLALGMSALLLAKESNNDALELLATQIMNISDKATLQKAFEMVRQQLQDPR
jgi:hypothetical protein